MAKCENLAGCPFYQGKMTMDSGIGAMYKKKYCEEDKLSCARYMVASRIGKQYVTLNLYPNMQDQAKKILAEHGVKL